MARILKEGGIDLPPLNFRLLNSFLSDRQRGDSDLILEATWGDRSDQFICEYKSGNTPRIFAQALLQAHSMASKTVGLLPMVVVPYLSEERLFQLEVQGVSGIDLCGNGVVISPKFRIWRSGKPNRYKNSAPIKNIYRGNSSLFSRSFLLRGEFNSLADLHAFTLDRFAGKTEIVSHFLSEEDESLKFVGTEEISATQLAKSTASKVVKSLVEDLLVIRENDVLRLVNPMGLLTALRENYRNPARKVTQAKTSLSSEECWRRLGENRHKPRFRNIATGLGSASHYEVLSGQNSLQLYVDQTIDICKLLESVPTKVFPNLEIIEVDGNIPFFDGRLEGERLWSSPIQTWIELANGNSREQDAARLLESDILANLKERNRG